jgi:hypothetical protein
MPESHLRAADADRAAVATALGRHMAAGRLTLEEYDERLARAYAARTYGELDELTADLPATGRPPAPQAPRPEFAAPARACGPLAGPWGRHGGASSSWRAWLSTALVVITVWAATSIASGGFIYFWPVWVIGPWGAVLLAQTLTGGRDERHEHRQLGS